MVRGWWPLRHRLMAPTSAAMALRRDWYHVTWNNCLVENSAEVGRHVYLPTFGHGVNADLAVIDEWTERFWSARGFTVHLLADFTPFAERQGVVHCIKKYLARGP